MMDNERLDSFHFFGGMAVMSNTAMSIAYKFFCGPIFLNLSGVYLEMELLGHKATC